MHKRVCTQPKKPGFSATGNHGLHAMSGLVMLAVFGTGVTHTALAADESSPNPNSAVPTTAPTTTAPTTTAPTTTAATTTAATTTAATTTAATTTAATTTAPTTTAAENVPDTNQTLQTIDVTAEGVSAMDAASAGDISQQQLQAMPLLRPGAVLETVPGLIVTQHSGEGKANQYFLRAFNLDHGTDLATEVDNVPINMPTHAHGQGYTDLNFLIPELVTDLHYKKGPYYADEGDFATAGAVRMSLANQVDDTATLGIGQDGYERALVMGTEYFKSGSTLLYAGEAYHNNGPWQNPDDYNKLNGLLRYYHGNDQSYYTITGQAYRGTFNATNQTPFQANGQNGTFTGPPDTLISRWGTLNPTDGGKTTRDSLAWNDVSKTDTSEEDLTAYVIKYTLQLYSTFTFDLQDPYNGDQFNQHDNRVVYGFKGSKTFYGDLAGMDMSNVIGLQTRVDDIGDVGINHTIDRRVLFALADNSVVEAQGAAYFENNLQWRKDVRTVVGLRYDEFTFDVRDNMVEANGTCDVYSDPNGCDNGEAKQGMWSPKAGLILGPWAKTEYFVNFGDGYHSNDARGVTRSDDFTPIAAPASALAANPALASQGPDSVGNPNNPSVTPLTKAVAAETGFRTHAIPNNEFEADAFLLDLQSELVFDGDHGATAPSGATRRTGIELTDRYQFTSWLSGDINGAFSKARFRKNVPLDDQGCGLAGDWQAYGLTPLPASETSGQYAASACSPNLKDPAGAQLLTGATGKYIPNSPDRVVDATLVFGPPMGWYGSLRAREFGPSPLIEDDSVKSPEYMTFDLQAGYNVPKKWKVMVDVFNVLDKKYNDIVYYYVYRLPGQSTPQAGEVGHSGVPRTLRLSFTYDF